MVNYLGHILIQFYQASQDFIKMLSAMMLVLFKKPFRTKDIIKQLYFVFYESAPVVAFSVCSAAAVTIFESSFHMKMLIQNDSLVPGFAALLILRELGVIVASLLITSRVGAGMTAEVGTMQITEQIDAYKMLGMNPIKYILVPRFIACIVGGVLMSFLANLVCLYMAMLISNYKMGYSAGLFIASMRSFVGLQDLFFAAIKGGVFGAVIPLVSCYYGFRCKAGAEGVGRATTNSVVTSSVAIIILDFLLTWIFTQFY